MSDLHVAGAKDDAEKRRMGLVVMGFARALDAVADVATFGARKYTDDGWVSVPDGQRRYTDAMLRHITAEGRGEAVDAESGLAHAAHAAWNSLARLELALRAADKSDSGRRLSQHEEEVARAQEDMARRTSVSRGMMNAIAWANRA